MTTAISPTIKRCARAEGIRGSHDRVPFEEPHNIFARREKNRTTLCSIKEAYGLQEDHEL
ncbi:MAG: hypothetical protein J0G95_11730 [Rhizobiales bacterium]|nr:hypothetical protein [Hyphomicrobiales bacterium]